MASIDLNAQKRENLAISYTKAGRKKGIIPGVFYYKGHPSIPIAVKEVALNPFVFTSEVCIINLLLSETGESYKCILKDVQFDPISDKPIHFDLLGISEDEKIKLEIPVQLVGTPQGVKDGGIIQHTIHKLEVICLPKDIPSHIDVNIESLMIGDAIRASDIKTENYEIITNADATIVSVVPPTVEKVEEVVSEEAAEAESAEPEVISKGKKEEEGEETE